MYIVGLDRCFAWTKMLFAGTKEGRSGQGNLVDGRSRGRWPSEVSLFLSTDLGDRNAGRDGCQPAEFVSRSAVDDGKEALLYHLRNRSAFAAANFNFVN